jgi:Co/Zn/Cd efflux system component
MTPQELMLTMHVCINTEPTDPTDIIRRVKAQLREEYSIGHSTIELEMDDCADH